MREWLGDEWEVKRNPTDRQKGRAGAGEFEIVGPHQFPFAIECKAHESLDYGQLFRVPVTGPFLGFWRQTRSQAVAARKRPLLIMKRNNGPILCVMEPNVATSLLEPLARLPCLSMGEPRCTVLPLHRLLSQPCSRLFEIR